jgi:hypothetical protein
VQFRSILQTLKRQTDWLVALFMWPIVAWPFVGRPGSVYGFDTLTYTGPNLDSVFDSWKLGKIPLWESGFFGGVPYLGRLGAQALYFPHLLLAVLPVNRAIEISTALHLLLLAVGTVLLARRGLRLASPAGGVAAVIVLGSAHLAIKTLSFDQLIAISLLPWILLFIEEILRGTSRWAVSGLVLSTSLLVLGGHPQYIYMEAVFALLYIAGRLVDQRSIKGLKDLLIAAGLTLGVCSLQLYATYSLTGSSAVGGKRSLESLSAPGFVADPARLNLAVVGDAFSSSPIGVSGSAEAILGIGIFAVTLSVIGICFLVRCRKFGLLSALTLSSIVGVLLAVGPRWWPFRLAYEVLPGIGSARVPGRWLVLALFGCAVLAAYGVHSLGEREFVGRSYYACLAGIIGTVGVLLSPRFVDVGNSVRNWWIFAGVVSVVAVTVTRKPRVRLLLPTLMVILVAVEGGIAGNKGPAKSESNAVPFEQVGRDLFAPLKGQPGKIFSMTYDKIGDKEYLVTGLRPNTHLYTDLDSIDGYDGGMWIQKRWVQAMGLVSLPSFNTDLTVRSQVQFPVEGRDMARFGVRWIITDTTVLPGGAQFVGFTGPVVKEGPIEIWENTFWRGESFVYVKTRPARSSELATDLLTGPKAVAPNVGVVEKPGLRLTCKDNCEPRTLSIIYQTNDAGGLLFEIDRPGVLVIGQSWSPDWKVYVNGVRTQPFPVDVNMLGVEVPPGRHEVTFKYSPSWFRPLFVLSLFSLLLTLAHDLRRCKRRRHAQEHVIDVPVDNS